MVVLTKKLLNFYNSNYSDDYCFFLDDLKVIVKILIFFPLSYVYLKYQDYNRAMTLYIKMSQILEIYLTPKLVATLLHNFKLSLDLLYYKLKNNKIVNFIEDKNKTDYLIKEFNKIYDLIIERSQIDYLSEPNDEVNKIINTNKKIDDLIHKRQETKKKIDLIKYIVNTIESLFLNRKGYENIFFNAKYSKAENLIQKSLSLLESNFSNSNDIIIKETINLACIYSEQKKYNEAENIYLDLIQRIKKQTQKKAQILNTYNKLPSTLFYTMNNLGVLYFNQGKYKLSEKVLKEALELFPQSSTSMHLLEAITMGSLAEVYRVIGKYNKSDIYFRGALGLIEQGLSLRGISKKEIQNFLLSFEKKQFNLDLIQKNRKKRILYYFMRPFYTNEEYFIYYMLILGNIAELYFLQGRVSEAESIHLTVLNFNLRTFNTTHPHTLRLMQNISTSYLRTGRYSEGKKYALQALKSVPKKQEYNEYISCYLSNLSVVFTNNKEYKRAELLAKRALNLSHGLANNLYNELYDYNNLGWIYIKQNHFQKAELMLKKTIQISKKIDLKTDIIELNLNTLALLLFLNNKYSETFYTMVEANEVSNYLINEILSTNSQFDSLFYLQNIIFYRDLFISFVTNYLPSFSEGIQNVINLVLKRKGLTLTISQMLNKIQSTKYYPDLEEAFQELLSIKQEIVDISFNHKQKNLNSQRKYLDELKYRKTIIERQLTSIIPDVKLERRLQNADTHSVTRNLPYGTILIDFVYFYNIDLKTVFSDNQQSKKPHYLACILLGKRPESGKIINLGPAEEIDEKIKKFRSSITSEIVNSDCDRNFKSVPATKIFGTIDYGIELRKIIFDPLIKFIGDCKHLFLSPDGNLAKIPFEVLPLNNGCRLIDRYKISYLNNGRDVLLFGAATKNVTNPSLVIADPDYNLNRKNSEILTDKFSEGSKQSKDLKSENFYFEPLPGTKKEAKEIATKLGVKPWMQADVLKSKLKQTQSPYILHIATHGFFLKNQKSDVSMEKLRTIRIKGIKHFFTTETEVEDPMLRSGLVFAGANTWLQKGLLFQEGENGILTAEEISNLDLFNTELVVLSACDTGLGDIQVSEGVFGLQRAFLLAGAKTIIMSLWKVPDQQTQELMVYFYNRILAGESRSDALREAQLAMKAKYSNPLYWGAFICLGNINPLLGLKQLN